jgi:hypothetical protein
LKEHILAIAYESKNLFLPYCIGKRNQLLSKMMDELLAYSIKSENFDTWPSSVLTKIYHLDCLEIPEAIDGVFLK